MYIYLFEDGEIRKGTIFNDSESEACDDGILDVIDISGDIPKQYLSGKWHDIDSIDSVEE